MKNSGRDVLTGMLDFQYRMKKRIVEKQYHTRKFYC